MSSDASVNPQNLTDKKKAINDVEARLAQLNLTHGSVEIAPKKEPGSMGVQQLIDTNLYQVKVQEGIVIYRYDATLTGKSTKDRIVELTKRTDSSAVLAGRVQECRTIFRMVMETYHQRLNWEKHSVYFDLQSILYTLKPIEFFHGEEQIDLTLDHNLPSGLATATMTIKNVHEGSQVIHLSDFTALIDPVTMARDRSVLNFIEMAVNQYPAHNEHEFLTLRGSTVYLMDGRAHGLPERDLGRGGTKYLASGVKKSAVLIEGQLKKDTISDGSRNIGLMLEAKHSPFYSTMNLIECVRRNEKTASAYDSFITGQCNDRQISYINFPFKKILFDAKYPNGKPRRVEFKCFSLETARNHRINDDQTVLSYFLEKYDYRMKYPDAHLAIVKVGTKPFPYPAEVLYVADNQLVNVEQMDDVSKAQMIKECAVRPDQMKKDNAAGAVAIKLRDSQYTQNAGIKFTKDPIGVYSRVLPPPTIGYANNSNQKVGTREAAWRGDLQRYKDAAKNGGGFALYQITRGQPLLHRNDMEAFAMAIRRASDKMGMELGKCEDMGSYEEVEVVDCCKYAHDNNITFVFFISPRNVKTCHSVMKMCEHRYGIVTQDIQADTARKCIGSGAATLENFLAKTNIKMGGLNYSVKAEHPDVQRELEETLFIGISSNQPGSKTVTDKVKKTVVEEKPGVLGYSANMDADYNRFYGDFVYTSAYRHDYFIYLQKIMEKCVWRYKKNRGHAPPRIVFYYTGLAEGQFQNALKYAVPLMQQGICDGNDGEKVPLTVLAAQKLNNMRLLPREFPKNGGKDHEFNVPHGTVVDRAVVNPVYNEFYLNAHSALVGTARSPRFNIVFDENDYSNDIVQGFTHVLAYEHQIVPRATALPTPIYVAEGYAVRGRDIFNAASHDNEFNKRLPREGDGYDIPRLSEALNYSGSTYEFLSERRVNA